MTFVREIHVDVFSHGVFLGDLQPWVTWKTGETAAGILEKGVTFVPWRQVDGIHLPPSPVFDGQRLLENKGSCKDHMKLTCFIIIIIITTSHVECVCTILFLSCPCPVKEGVFWWYQLESSRGFLQWNSSPSVALPIKAPFKSSFTKPLREDCDSFYPVIGKG